MRKLKLLFTGFAFLGGVFSANAQTDVTSTYLTNADFSETTPITGTYLYGYGKDGSPYGYQTVDGWTSVVTSGDNSNASYPNSGTAAAVFSYGSSTQLKGNATAAPATNPDGEASGNCFGFFGVWGCGGYYYQNVTLAAGKYTITVPMYSQSGTQANTTYTGFFPTSGTNRTVAVNPTVGEWANQSVTFTLTDDTEGQIRIGYQSTGSGSGANPMLFIDCVKIEFTAIVVKDVLETAITAATKINTALEGALNDAIATAQAVYNDENATQEEVNAAAETLNNAVNQAMATASNINVTDLFLTNADLTSTEGWTAYASGTSGTNYQDYSNGLIGDYTVRFSPATVDDTHLATEYCFGFECRWSSNYASYNQTTGPVPAGVYTLTFDVENVNGSTTSANYNNLFYLEAGSNKVTDTATEWMQGGSNWTTHTIRITLEEATPLKVSFGYGTGSNNIGAANTPALYVSHIELNYSGLLAGAKAAWDDAKAKAEAAIADEAYKNVKGSEFTNLEAEIAKAEPTTVDGYNEAAADLSSATEAFKAAKTNYDALVVEIRKAKALGIDDATADGYAATSSSTAASALISTQNLKVAEYNYVTTNYQHGVALGEWTSTGTNTSAATFSNEHWSGETHEYKNQNDNNGQGWNAQSWSIDFSQEVPLPAGNYVFKVAGRQASGDAVNTSLVVTNKSDDSVLGTVSDFPRSNKALGINKEGATSFDPEDPAGFANDGNGFGWEWRYVKFTLASDATVIIAVNAVATDWHQWVSFGDYTLQTDNEANISLIEYNVALASAQTTIADDTYKNVTGSEKTDLQAAIDADASLDKTDKDAIDAAKDDLETATDVFTGAKAAYDAYVAAKAVVYENNLPYASSTKFEAIATAQGAADATSASDATTKTNAIISAYRKYIESNALAEGVDGAEQIAIADYRFANMDEEDIDAANWKIGENWVLDGQNNGTIQLTNSGSFTDGDGNADYNYIHIQKNDNNAGIHQTINLEPGRYIMTVTARCQSGQGAKFEAFAGGVWVNIPQNNNTGGQFDRGWNDVSVVFDVLETKDIDFGVKSDYGRNIWWSATRFRLVKLGNAQVTIDEMKNYAVAAATCADVTLNRTFKAGKWNTFVVPFDIKNTELIAKFGDDVAVAEYSEEADGDNSTVSFKTMDIPAITANTPVLLKTSTDNSSFVFTGKQIKTGEAKVAGKANFDFVGTYDATLTIDEGDYFISDNKLWKAEANKTTIKGTRAYIKAKNKDADARIIDFLIDGQEATGISTITTQKFDNATYDMQGRRVETLKKGIYVVNGKKVVVK